MESHINLRKCGLRQKIVMFVIILLFTVKPSIENGYTLLLQGRELFTRMLEVFVLKFKTISETQLPYLLNKW
jgi:hypothetical protein